ncbi:hypothetical protein [Virgibacillus necropolis]|nr:hypothetical protein [Virgibacillus necropolis]
MTRFEMLAGEFKTKLGRDLSQKEIDWIQWVIDKETIEKRRVNKD